MPLNSAQLAALVDRARQKAPPVVNSPPQPAAQRPVRTRQAKPAPTPPAAQPPPESQPPGPTAVPLLPPGHTAEAEDFPIGWHLDKSTWQFHRRFFRVFRRPMRPGEYSHLLKQIHRGGAQQLDADSWRVTLPDGRTTLPVRVSGWRLITILPKNWQPPTAVAPSFSGSAEHAQEPNL